MAQFIERYHAMALAAGSTTLLPNNCLSLGGFLCTVSGTMTVTTANGIVKINALPVSAGVYYPMPFLVGAATVALTSAAGTLGYSA